MSTKGKWAPRGPRLELKCANPRKSAGADDKWEVTVTAQLFGSDGKPEKEGKKIIFSISGSGNTEERETNGLGVAGAILEATTPGKHFIYALAADGRISQDEMITIVADKPREEKKRRIVLRCSIPQEAGNAWTVRASAQLFESNGMLAEKGKKVLFSVDGRQEGSGFETNDLGVAEATLTISQPGRHDLHAMASERDAFQSVSLDVPEKPKEEKKEKSKQPKSIHVANVGRHGRYEITVNVLDEHDAGVSGAVVRLMDERVVDKMNEDVTTNDRGVAVFKKEFDDHVRIISIIVLGTPIKRSLRLSGPRRSAS